MSDRGGEGFVTGLDRRVRRLEAGGATSGQPSVEAAIQIGDLILSSETITDANGDPVVVATLSSAISGASTTIATLS